MRFRKGAALALGILLLFALLLAQDPEEEENGLPDEAGLEDPAPIPFTVFYLDKEKNLIRLDLHDKTSTVVAENVATFVADETNRRIAMAIPAEDEMLEEQGVAEIILYSAGRQHGSPGLFLHGLWSALCSPRPVPGRHIGLIWFDAL